jgi:hypothetical protein
MLEKYCKHNMKAELSSKVSNTSFGDKRCKAQNSFGESSDAGRKTRTSQRTPQVREMDKHDRTLLKVFGIFNYRFIRKGRPVRKDVIAKAVEYLQKRRSPGAIRMRLTIRSEWLHALKPDDEPFKSLQNKEAAVQFPPADVESNLLALLDSLSEDPVPTAADRRQSRKYFKSSDELLLECITGFHKTIKGINVLLETRQTIEQAGRCSSSEAIIGQKIVDWSSGLIDKNIEYLISMNEFMMTHSHTNQLLQDGNNYSHRSAAVMEDHSDKLVSFEHEFANQHCFDLDTFH